MTGEDGNEHDAAGREPGRPPADVEEALRALGKDRLVLAIHDASFPGAQGEDLGRGSPNSRGGRAFLRFVRSLGFDGIQLGPQGQTTLANPSPYESSLFSRNFLSVALGALVDDPRFGGLLSRETLRTAVEGKPPGEGRVHASYSWRAQSAALDEAYATFRRGRPSQSMLGDSLASFRRENSGWLAREEALAARRGDDPDAYSFRQFVLEEQHLDLRALCREIGLRLYADLAIGCSLEDRETFHALFLPGYLLGAPPSRTNPAGQPWGYPVLDPRRYAHGGLDLLQARIERAIAGYDGVRLDHPHGLVCPWVYRADAASPEAAVQAGARLFSSPDLPDHPELAPLAIARPEQLDRSLPRHADGWVRELDEDQVRRYGVLVDAVVARAEASGWGRSEIACEVLSTLPYPLRRVLERHGLGRMRVAQKAALDDPADVCRSENAAPEDWIMAGTHDTPPVWLVVERWRRKGEIERRAAYLAEHLASPEARAPFARRLVEDRGELVHAFFADVFASPARHVSIFWTDLLGIEELYNEPGTSHERNWTLRVPPDFEARYRTSLARGDALDLGRALRMAVDARRRFGDRGQSK